MRMRHGDMEIHWCTVLKGTQTGLATTGNNNNKKNRQQAETTLTRSGQPTDAGILGKRPVRAR